MPTRVGLWAAVGAGSVAMLVAVGVAGAAHPGGGIRWTRAEMQAQRYVERAVLKAVNGPECQPRRYRATYPGPPPAGFRSVLGILRGRPTRRSAAALRRIVGGNDIGLFANYVRLARVVDGVSYYVFVSESAGGLPPANVSRCLAAERAAFAAELPLIPAALQQPAKRVFALNLAADRRADRQPVRETVALFGQSAGGGGGGVSGATATEIRVRGMYGSTCCSPGTVLSGVVPDRVATVTFIYPRRRSTGRHPRWRAATEQTANVVNNVVVTATPRGSTFAFRQVWRAADGRILRVVPSSG